MIESVAERHFFDAVAVDVAGQATIPELCVPIATACAPARDVDVFFFGDPAQLAATIFPRSLSYRNRSCTKGSEEKS